MCNVLLSRLLSQSLGGEVREGEVREGEVREGEGVVAVRSKMDVALPNSAGLYLHWMS